MESEIYMLIATSLGLRHTLTSGLVYFTILSKLMHILKSIHHDLLNHAQFNQHLIHTTTHNKTRVFVVTADNYKEINYEIYRV